MNKLLIIAAAALVGVGALLYFIAGPGGTPPGEYAASSPARQQEVPENPGASAPPASAEQPAPPTVPPPASQDAVKEFTLTASNFKFSATELRVQRGNTVKLTLKNAEGRHDWNVDEFNAATQVLQAGQEETISFTADKTGSFEYYCSVGTHRQMGMKGTLVVEP
jgi:VCBS repeat-containing protein